MKEKLQGQQVYTALASLPLVVASSLVIGGDEKRPNSIAGIEIGGMINALSS